MYRWGNKNGALFKIGSRGLMLCDSVTFCVMLPKQLFDTFRLHINMSDEVVFCQFSCSCSGIDINKTCLW